MQIILIDLDNTVANWNQHLQDKLSKQDIHINIFNRKYYDIYKSFPKYTQQIKNIIDKKGFYKELKPIQYSIQTIQQLMQHNTVFFVTSPPKHNSWSFYEKVEWVQKYFNTKNIIITYDKTLVKGDILIDDKPTIEGCTNKDYKHIIYKQSYNNGTFEWHLDINSIYKIKYNK